MSVNLNTLKLVIELAQRRRDDAGLGVARALQALAQARAQQDQLLQYAQEGEARWQERSQIGVSAVLLQHQRSFGDKVRHALEFQQGVIAQREDELARARDHLAKEEQALATLNKVDERVRQAQAQLRDRREQKLTDEMAMAMLAFQRRQAEQEHFA